MRTNGYIKRPVVHGRRTVWHVARSFGYVMAETGCGNFLLIDGLVATIDPPGDDVCRRCLDWAARRPTWPIPTQVRRILRGECIAGCGTVGEETPGHPALTGFLCDGCRGRMGYGTGKKGDGPHDPRGGTDDRQAIPVDGETNP